MSYVAYVDFVYYETVYLGTLLNELQFNKRAKSASRYLDYFTFNRSKTVDPVTDDIKDCICEMAECIHSFESINTSTLSGNSGVKSESIDGYSVTYLTEGKDGEVSYQTLKRKLYQIVEKYLSGTELLYRGVY